MMMGLIVVRVVMLAGCAQVKTLEEPAFAALQSGDGSAGDKREKKIERCARQRGMSCGNNKIASCEQRVRGLVCTCRSRDEIDDVPGRLQARGC